MMKRILVLGDGDFSFSATLIGALSELSDFKSFIFLITSFDDSGELVTKYSETDSILKRFAKLDNVTVKHGVDATVSMTELLNYAHVPDFTDVIFNFPHLGIENARLHSSLLSHFLHHARQVLSADGIVYVSLALAQAERWELEKSATSTGFRSCDTVAFDLHHSWGTTYNIKRHHNGQSFARRVGDCACFCFRKQGAQINVAPPGAGVTTAEGLAPELLLPDGRNPNVFRLGILLLAARVTAVIADGSTDSAAPVPGANGALSAPPSTKRARKEGKSEAVSGDGYVRRMLDAGAGAPPTVAFECRECGKQFPLEQGVRSHVRLVHVLGRGAPAAQPLPCPHCAREFRQQASLDDHLLAKHTGVFSAIAPDWAVGAGGWSMPAGAAAALPGGADQTDAELSHQCSICQLRFGSEEELVRHVAEGVNPELVVSVSVSGAGAALACSRCGRQCRDLRSLRQHHNFCTAQR
jgi:hypothetical protein